MTANKQNSSLNKEITIEQLKIQLENARLKYKPAHVQYLLIAEAPPDGLERFFYYESVKAHDYLFLGVAEALCPNIKKELLSSGRNSNIKRSILLEMQANGFYLLDLAELPISLLNTDLSTQLPNLVKRIKHTISSDTKIILIKTTVYDMAFRFLQEQGLGNVINVRIPFPGQGFQKAFQQSFKKALQISGYFSNSLAFYDLLKKG